MKRSEGSRREVLESLAQTFIIYLTALLILILAPIILILSSPIFICRILVDFSARWAHPNLEEMVGARSVLFAIDPLYTKPKYNIVTRLLWTERIELAELRERVFNRVLSNKPPNVGGKFAELKYRLTKWMGFYFWEKDDKFNISNHVTEWEKETEVVYTDQEVKEVMTKLLQKPWVQGRPLWEIILIQNCRLNGIRDTGSQTVFFLRVHHTLGDGYSILSLIYEGLLGMETNSAVPSCKKISYLKLTLYWLNFPFRCAYEIAESSIVLFLPWVSLPLSCPADRQTGIFNIQTSEKIPLQKIKEIRKFFDVSFSSVLLAASTGVMRDMMIRKGIFIPPKYHFILPMPLPGHPQKLSNYLGFGVTVLPVRETDPVKRLQFCFKEYERLKTSAFLAFSKYYLYFVGSYFPAITELWTKHSSAFTMLTNFSGGLDRPTMAGNDVVDVIFMEGPVGHGALTICVLSFVDGLRISSIADACVLNQEDVEELTLLFKKHLDILYEKIVQ